MISTSYPVKGEDFLDRREILKRLSHAHKRKQNVALIGQRRIGKSSIAIEFCRRISKEKKVIPVYFKVHQNLGSPGRFGIRLLISILSAYAKQPKTKIDHRLLKAVEIKPDNLLDIAKTIDSDVLMDITRFLISYFPPTKSNERIVLERILKFMDNFAEEQEIEYILVLDEFQDIRELENYPSIGKGRLLPMLEGIISSQKHIWLLLTGSMVRLMSDILEDKDSPFYGRFEKILVKGFEEEDMLNLIAKVCNKPVSGEAKNLLWTLTSGNPYYVVIIGSCADFLESPTVHKKHIEEVFISSLIEGELNSHCNYLFDTSLGRVSKSGMLKEIVKCITIYGRVRASEIARYLGRDRGYISPLLRTLLNIDLIEKVDGKYQIADTLLSLWLKNIYLSGFPTEKINISGLKKDINKNYLEIISKLKQERGFLFESHMRELLRKFDGSKLRNRILPEFDKVDAYNIYDEEGIVFNKPSNIEIDALCTGEKNWLLEFKYTGKLTTKKDIRLLLQQKILAEKRLQIPVNQLCFISTTGFTEKCLEFADDNNIWCIDQTILNDLLKKHNMHRFVGED